jgi:hypothetical protein
VINKKPTMSIGPIPTGVFWFCLCVNVVFYATVLPVYFFRRNIFPIEQRLPLLATLAMLVLAYISIVTSLVGALPDNLLITNCKWYSLASTIPANIGVSLSTYRISWLVFRDYLTRRLVRGDKIKLDLETSSQDMTKVDLVPKRKSCWKLIPEALSFLLELYFELCLKFIRPALIPALTIAPCVVIIVIEILVFYRIEAFANVTVFSTMCTMESFSSSQTLEALMYLYLTGCVFLSASFLLKVKDNFGLGTEMRLLILPLLISANLFFVMATVPNAFEVVFIQTRFWVFLIGCIVAPMAVMVQSIYPLILSFRHQRKYPKSYKMKINLDMRDSAKKVVTTGLLKDDETLNSTAHHANQMALDFENWIESADGRQRFLEFLQKEFSVENLLFFEESKVFYRKYSALDSSTNLDAVLTCQAFEDAVRIRDTYILQSALSCINIPASMRHEIEEILPSKYKRVRSLQVEYVPPDMFQKANKEIFELMFRDSYTRYRMMHEDEAIEMNRTQGSKGPLAKVKSLLNIDNGRFKDFRDNSSVSSNRTANRE